MLQIQKQNIKKSMQISYYEAGITSFVVGLAENYFAAYAIQSGHSALQSGLLVSLPLILAAIIQFFAQPYVQSSSLSSFVTKANLLQSLSLLSLAFVSLFILNPPFLILLFLYSLYWLGQFSIQPAWNRWIAEIVPINLGQNYFSIRTRLNQVGIILGLIIGGLTLHLNIIQISTSYLFFGLFSLSFFCKIITYFLFQKHPPVQISIYLSRDKMKFVLKKHKKFFKNFSLFNFSIYLSAPFVAGYLLQDRHVNYFEFMLIMLGLFLGKIFMSTALHQSKKQIDPTFLMFIGGLTAAPLPILWPFCTNIFLMFLTHLLSGIAWASWEVGLSLYFFKNIEASEKMETISLYSYISVITQVSGTCVGALLVQTIFISNYNYLFIFAGIVRLICALILMQSSEQSITKPPTSL